MAGGMVGWSVYGGGGGGHVWERGVRDMERRMHAMKRAVRILLHINHFTFAFSSLNSLSVI